MVNYFNWVFFTMSLVRFILLALLVHYIVKRGSFPKLRPMVVLRFFRKLKSFFWFSREVGSEDDATAKVRTDQEEEEPQSAGFRIVAESPGCQSTNHSAPSGQGFSVKSVDASSTNFHNSHQFRRAQVAAERLGLGYRVWLRFCLERIRSTLGESFSRSILAFSIAKTRGSTESPCTLLFTLFLNNNFYLFPRLIGQMWLKTEKQIVRVKKRKRKDNDNGIID